MNKIKENPELAGKVIGMPPTVSAIPDLSMSSPTAGAGNPLALTVNGQHKSVGEQATKALRELFVSLPNNCSEAELSGFLAAQCHELGICQMDMERPVLSARVNVVKQFAFCKQAIPSCCTCVLPSRAKIHRHRTTALKTAQCTDCRRCPVVWLLHSGEFATVEICDGVFNKLNNAQMGTGNLRFGRPKAYEQLQAAGQLPGQTAPAGAPRLCLSVIAHRMPACLPARLLLACLVCRPQESLV